MKTTVIFLALLGTAFALPSREKRQATGCLSSFLNVPNVCANNAKGQVFFQHPSDPSKFLQCDINKRMYIVQCPTGEVFNIVTSACQPAPSSQTTLPLPQTNAPGTVQPPTPIPGLVAQKTPGMPTKKPTTGLPPQQTPGLLGQKTPGLLLPGQQQTAGLPPQMTPGVPVPTTAGLPPVTTSNKNPCSATNMALGKIYFPFPGDRAKFYECDSKGNPKLLACPPSLQWDQSIQSCVYPVNINQLTGGNTPAQVKPTSKIPSGLPSNPCTAKAISAGHFFFPHPDPNKYIQCDMWGDAFTNSCPTKLVWNAALETCYSPLLINGRK